MNETSVAKKELTQSERFMNKVISEFKGGVGELALTDFQKRLAQNYFIALDASLKAAEEKRLKKKNNQDALPVVWANVNMEKLARDVVSAARIGFDPAQKNHINLVPYKNNALGKYDIGLIEGYRGIELKATKYGRDIPDFVTVEVVYSTDRFKSVKKDRNNAYDAYEFEITNEFDRGEVVGGFYYHLFNEAPEKNRLVVMSLKEILKRKPEYASVEFWGGEKDKWENGKKVGKEQVEGWYDQMVRKTVYRAAYGDITIDSQKIDDDYMRLRQLESSFAEAEASEEINQNANRQPIDIDYSVVDEGNPIPEDEGSEEPGQVDQEPAPTSAAADENEF